MANEELMKDPYSIVESEPFKNAVTAMAAHEKLHPRATLDALLLTALEHIPMEAPPKPTGYPAGVDWSRPAPDDSEADEAIAEAGTLNEAIWEFMEKFDVPVTNNEVRWQDGQYLREAGNFIGEIRAIFARFPEETKLDNE
jgi:hypothetical protein